MKTKDKRQDFYLISDVEDLPSEVWVDVVEFDGLYQVSNYGRVKSLPREITLHHGGMTLTKEKILRQSRLTRRGKKQECVVTLQYLDTRKTKHVSRLVYESFHPEATFEELDCVMHINKIITDNRLCNLKKTTRKISKNIDMIKSKPTISATPRNLEAAQRRNKDYFESRTHKTCSNCGKVDVKENFPKDVSRCQTCINESVVKRRNNYESKAERECSKCGETKSSNMFWKNRGWCNKCMAEYAKSRRAKKKESTK